MGIIYKKEISLSGEAKEKYFTELEISRREDKKTSRIYPEFCVGFIKEGGAIRSAPSVKKIFSSSAKIEKMYAYTYVDSSYAKKVALFGVDSSGYIYITDLTSAFSKLPVCMGGNVTALPYTDLSGNKLFLFLSDNGAYKYDGNKQTFTLMSAVPNCICAQVHSERLFIVSADGITVRFSKALDIEDWTEGEQSAGYVQLPSAKGNIISMVSFNGYLYLFRERGITRLRAMGDNMNFQHIEIDAHCGNIYRDSITVCGEYIAFASDGGAFLFDGDEVKLISDEAVLSAQLNTVTAAARYRGCALMCLSLNGAFVSDGLRGMGSATSEAAAYAAYGEYGGKAVLIIDPERAEACALPYPVYLAVEAGDSLYVYDSAGNLGKLYIPTREQSGEYAGGALGCVWDSGLTDFSLGDKKKNFRRAYIKGEGDYLVTVYNEKRAIRFACSGNSVVRPMLFGREFGIRISGGNAKIYSLEVRLNEN